MSRLNRGYVLHPQGIEVIALRAYDRGPVVAWDTDPRGVIGADPGAWHPDSRAPIVPPRFMPHLSTTVPATAPTPHRTAHR